MLNRKLALFVAWMFLAAVGAVACGEDPPPPKPADKKQAAKDEGEGKKKEGTKDDEGKAKEGEEKAGDKAGDDQGAPSDEAKTPERPAAPNIHMQRTLSKVTAYGVTGPLNGSMAKLQGVLPPPMRVMADTGLEGLLQEVAGKSGMKNMDWLDRTRGIGFGFEGKDKPLIAVPIVGSDAFKAALPDGAVQDENHGYVLGDSYVMPYGKYLLVSDSFRTIDIVEGDLKLELTRLTTDKLVLVTLEGHSLKTLASSILDEMEREMGENMPMQQDQKEFLARAFNFAKEALADLDKLTVTLDLLGNDMVIRTELLTLKGTKLATSFGALRPGAFKSATLLPGKSYLVGAQYYPSESFTPWLPRYVDLMASAWKLGLEEKMVFSKLYAELISYYGPDSAFAVYTDSGFPMSMTGIATAVDGLKVRDLMYQFYQMLFAKVIQDLPPENRQMFHNRSLKEVVDGLAPVFANLGLGIQMQSEDYRIGKVDSIVIEFDWVKLKLPPEVAWVQDIIKRRLGGAMGFSKDYVVGAFGPNCVVRVKEVLDLTPGLKLTDFFGPAFDESKYWMVFGVSAPQLVDAIMGVKVLADAIGNEYWVQQLRNSSGLLVYAGKLEEDGIWIEGKLDVRTVVEAAAPAILKSMTEKKDEVRKPATEPTPRPEPAPEREPEVEADPAIPAE